jgi:pimeloyl-ACP methyl ester carboxylesterase
MSATRLLLVPQLTELEWRIKPLLEEWAEVASYDAPGVGDEPQTEPLTPDAVARRGLEEIERQGWDRCVVVSDEFGGAAAARLASLRPEAVEAMALGHAALSHSIGTERAALNREVLAALDQLARHDPRTYVRQVFKMTGGEEARGGYGEELVEIYLERVPVDVLTDAVLMQAQAGEHIEDCLRCVEVPMLLAQHKGCLLFTAEGFGDAVAAFPHARVEAVEEKPSASPEFAQALRSFCEQLVVVR